MERAQESPREIAVPVSVFGSLRRELTEEAGPLPTIHALHHAGYEAGAAAAPVFAGGTDSVSAMGQSAFWSRLSSFFDRRGWGSLALAGQHGTVGILRSADWAESGDSTTDPDGSCHFSTGYFSGMLTELAGGPVAVLEVECRLRGDDACRWAFGAETTVHGLYGRLVEGTDLDSALAEL